MRRALPLAAALALSACVAGPPPDVATTAPTLPDTFVWAPVLDTEGAVARLLPQDDPAYRTLSQAVLTNGPTLAEALARVEAARASAARSGAERMPNVGANASLTGQRTSPNQFGTGLPPGVAFDTERVAYAANLTASWDVDLFGRLKAQERAALARLDAAGADAAAVRVAVLAEVAGAVIDWRTLQARQVALSEDLVAAETLVTLTDIRERAGIAPGFDRVRAETAAEASRSRIAGLASEEARIIGRLVTLTGMGGQSVRTALAAEQPLSPRSAAPAALPAELLANRPDVLAAQARLAASDADLAASAARRFPQLTLSAALGLLAFDLGELIDGDAVVGSAGAGLLAPLLDFGRIEAEIDASAANKRAAFAGYRGAVFAALGEAEAAYGLIAAADEEAAASAREAASADRAAQLAEFRFRAGLENFLAVLESRRAADASGERAAAAQGRAARARVLLWQALGGDYPASRSTSQ